MQSLACSLAETWAMLMWWCSGVIPSLGRLNGCEAEAQPGGYPVKLVFRHHGPNLYKPTLQKHFFPISDRASHGLGLLCVWESRALARMDDIIVRKMIAGRTLDSRLSSTFDVLIRVTGTSLFYIIYLERLTAGH